MLIDYLIGAALAIAGMLALLIFGTDIIRLNTEARQYWQAKSAMADFAGRHAIYRSETLASGMLCEGADPQWINAWCGSPQVGSLPNVCVSFDSEASRMTLHWGTEDCFAEEALTVSRSL